jgi:hypothetical protein
MINEKPVAPKKEGMSLKGKFKSLWGKVTGKKAEATTTVEYVEEDGKINEALFPDDDNFSVGGASTTAQKDGGDKETKNMNKLYDNATDNVPSTSFF